MTTLDDPRRIVDPSSISVWPTALRYGGIIGLGLIVLGLITYVSGLSDPANPSTASQMISCLNYIILIIGVVMVVKAHRDKDLGGYITLGRSMGVGTATALIVAGISAIWVVIFMSLISPDMGEAIKDAAMEKAQPGQEEMTEKIVGVFSNPYMLAFMTILIFTAIGFVTALIAGAIMKKEPAPTV